MSDDRLSILDRIRKRLNLNRASRMYAHYLAIKEEVAPKTGKAREEVEFFARSFEEYHRRTQRMLNIRFLFYLILYAGLAVNILKVIPILSFLVTFVEFGNALFGTTLAFFIIMWYTIRINLNLEIMNESLTHLIAVYHQNAKRDTKATIARIRKTI